MVISKNGKQLISEGHENYRVLSGTVDNKNPKALYLSISAWGESIIRDEVTYGPVLRNVTKAIKMKLRSSLNSDLFYVDRCIVDFDMRESGISYGKKSFMNCEITIFQKKLFKLQEKIIQKELNLVSKKITSEVLEDFKYFKFKKRKK
tara:strand:- start:1277 stop:1720 length:444 start_codon:yes stop_codon:yes gene_type:complete